MNNERIWRRDESNTFVFLACRFLFSFSNFWLVKYFSLEQKQSPRWVFNRDVFSVFSRGVISFQNRSSAWRCFWKCFQMLPPIFKKFFFRRIFAILLVKYLILNICIRPVKKSCSIETYNFIRNRLQHRCFPVTFAKYLKTPIL